MARIRFAPAVILPTGILAIIFLMILPIPPMLLDVFFVLNIALSVAVLMTAINAAKPLDFSSFPSVLLFATLLRLALNVASTRVVLLNGHEGEAAAGHVIEAFGAFLIGGDFAVGLFVFMILMIINLVVVTKGAGRVSEVSARFTLDALPGKQMAIDADLAAGLVTAEEAKARRRETATEADFYGSMDGASKFVKGDAIAALLILAVNIIAGLVLGVTSHGLSLAEAGSLYVTLAVGDALVASVPALLLSIAAAIIVTRVSDSRDLTGQIGGQFSDHRTWAPVAAIMLALACIPAMPQSVFLPFAGIAGAIWRTLRKRHAERMLPAPASAEQVEPAAFTVADIAEYALVTVEIGYGLVHLAAERKGAPLVARLTALRRQMSTNLGFIVPQFRVRDSFDCAPGEYRILLGGAPIAQGQIRPDRLLAIDTGDVVGDPATTGQATVDPSFDCPALWIVPQDHDAAVADGYLVVEPENIITTHVHHSLSAWGHLLCGPSEIAAIVDLIRQSHPALVDAITPQPLPLGALTRLLRNLLEDGIAIAHPVPLFNLLAQAVQTTVDHDQLVDLMRAAMGRVLVARIAGPTEPLPVITLDASLEHLIVSGMHDPATGQPVLDADMARTLGQEIDRICAARPAQNRQVALIVQPRARRVLTQLLRLRVPACTVLSINELPPEKPIDVIAVVGEQAAPAKALPTSNSLPEEVLAA